MTTLPTYAHCAAVPPEKRTALEAFIHTYEPRRESVPRDTLFLTRLTAVIEDERKERDALAAENEGLRQALCRYGMHLPSCPRSAVPPGNASCRCGLHTILAVPLKETTT